MYQFKHNDLRYSRGGLDEQLTYDRYAVSTHNPDEINTGDTVVAIIDKLKDVRRVATVKDRHNDSFTVETHQGDTYTVDTELVSKPLEHTPQQLWSRWAKGAASVEDKRVRVAMEDRFRRLLDGFGYSPGGRIQLSLGQEFVTGYRALLTAYNCFVLPSVRKGNGSVDQWMKLLDAAYAEMRTMRVGGGVGYSISDIATVEGAPEFHVTLILPSTHPDFPELQDKIAIGKFENVQIAHDSFAYNGEKLTVVDSIDGLVDAMRTMVELAYSGKHFAFDFSGVRHRHAIVKGVNGRSSGAVSWMHMYDLLAYLMRLPVIDAVDFAEFLSEVTLLIEQGGSR